MQEFKSATLYIILVPLALFFVPFFYVTAQEETVIAATTTTPTNDSEPPVTTASLATTYKIEKLDDDGRVFDDFVVGPGKVELELAPGESKTIELFVTNRMGEPKDFITEIEDVAGSRDVNQTVVLLGGDRGPYTLRDYVNIPSPRFTLNHMERARVPVTVSLPADAEPGGHYGSVLVSTVSRDADLDVPSGATPSSAIVSRIGTLFFVTSPGDIDTAGEFLEFTTVGNKLFYTASPINFALLFENNGSVHLNPYGEVSIKNMLGEEVGFIELDPWFSLPQSLRSREVSWSREFLFGRYEATANINRGYNDIVDTHSITFWVLPWKLLLVIFSALFIFFLLLRLVFSKFELKRK